MVYVHPPHDSLGAIELLVLVNVVSRRRSVGAG